MKEGFPFDKKMYFTKMFWENTVKYSKRLIKPFSFLVLFEGWGLPLRGVGFPFTNTIDSSNVTQYINMFLSLW